MNLPEEECVEILKIERYFPLLCKLYSSKIKFQNIGLRFFKNPVTDLEKEINEYRQNKIEKYCALFLLVLFNNDLTVSSLLGNDVSKNKFKHALKLCGMDQNTNPYIIGDTLESLKGFMVKKIGDTYQFYHDFVMGIIIHVFGKNYPAEIIMYSEIGFLRTRVIFSFYKEHNDPFTIYLNGRHIEKLGKRLFAEIFRDRFLDIILNPCLRKTKVTEVIITELKNHPEKLQLLLKKVLLVEKRNHLQNTFMLTKLAFLFLKDKISVLCALIVFGHNDMSLYSLKALKKKKIDLKGYFLFPAVCSNGSIVLFNELFEDHINEYLMEKWDMFYPVHIASVFHNPELLTELIKLGVDVNLRTNNETSWTPLMLAAGNYTQETVKLNQGISRETCKVSTIHVLVKNGANVNLRSNHGDTALNISCSNGEDSIAKILLKHGSDVNICDIEGCSPLYNASQNGHDSTVELLLNNGADVNSYSQYGFSPMYVAVQKGHDRVLQALLKFGSDINVCSKYKDTPLNIACNNGHKSIVQFFT